MAGATRDWAKLPTPELVAALKRTGQTPPEELIREIVRRGSEAVPALGRLVSDEKLWDSDGKDGWAPVSALHLLGAIGDPSAAPYIVAALRINPDPDEIVENTPTIIGHLGPEAIPEFARLILDEQVDGLMRGVACDGLASIALLYPASRGPIVSFLRRFVEEAPQHDRVAVTGAILTLVELRDSESLAAISKAFQAKRVDEDFLYMEDAREAMGQPMAISEDWHYTGDPLDYFSSEHQKKRAKKEEDF